jgi:TetR/AcrR family transcriptional regulator, cholesterol catabolism regulator
MARGSLSKGGRRLKAKDGNGKGAKNGSRGREQEILDAAIDIFHANGYSATSVDDVAASVGILKGSLYYYMDSKEDLLWWIVEEVHDDVEEVIEAALERTELPPLQRLADYVRAQVDYNARNIKRVRVYYHDYEQLTTDRLASVRKSRRANEQRIVDLVKDAKEAGEVPGTTNERVATKTAFATIAWMYTWYKPGGGVSGAELGDFCADFVVNGLRGPTPAFPSE